MTLRIADTFTAALTRLTAQEQAAAKQAAFDLQVDPSAPGLSLHRVDRSRDRDFWTARVTRDLRIVLHRRGPDTLLAWVGHHDDAYDWAVRRRLDARQPIQPSPAGILPVGNPDGPARRQRETPRRPRRRAPRRHRGGLR